MGEYEPDEQAKAAGGMDYDDEGHSDEERSDWRSRLEADGPLAMLEDVEEMIPEPVRVQVERFPLTALCVGLGVGIFLGMRKSEPIIAAVTSAVTATAARNFGSHFDV